MESSPPNRIGSGTSEKKPSTIARSSTACSGGSFATTPGSCARIYHPGFVRETHKSRRGVFRSTPRIRRVPPSRPGTGGRSGRPRGGCGRPRRTGRDRAPTASIERGVAPCTARSAATRATPGPHIIPWPPAEATVTPSIGRPVLVEGRPEDRQVVGREVDGGRPDPPKPEVAGRGDQARRAARASGRRSPSRWRGPRPGPRRGCSSRTAGRPPRAASRARRRCRRPSASARPRRRGRARGRRPCAGRRRPGSGRRPAGRPSAGSGRRSG